MYVSLEDGHHRVFLKMLHHSFLLASAAIARVFTGESQSLFARSQRISPRPIPLRTFRLNHLLRYMLDMPDNDIVKACHEGGAKLAVGCQRAHLHQITHRPFRSFFRLPMSGPEQGTDWNLRQKSAIDRAADRAVLDGVTHAGCFEQTSYKMPQRAFFAAG